MKSRISPSSQCDQGSTEKVKPKCFRWEGTREISFMHEKRGWGLQGRSPDRSSSQTGVRLGGDLGSPTTEPPQSWPRALRKPGKPRQRYSRQALCLKPGTGEVRQMAGSLKLKY